MVGFTGIVRPFETVNVNPPATPLTNPVGGQTAQVPKINTFKISGGPKTFTGSYNLTISYYKVRKPKEKQKT
jgi:hypothetical protein